MVKIARIGPGSKKLTTESSVAPRSLEAETQVSRATGGFLNAVQEVAQKFENIVSENEVLSSKQNARAQIAELEQKVTDDPNEWRDKYQGELDRIKSETSKNVSLPVHKNKYEFEYGNMATSSSIKIQNTIRKQDIIDRQTNMYGEVDSLGEEYAGIDGSTEMGAALKVSKLGEMERQFDESAAAGIITPLQARNNKWAEKEKWVEQEIRGRINSATSEEDFEAIKSMLTSESWDLNPEQISDWSSNIDKQKTFVDKKAKDATEKVQLTNEADAIINFDQLSQLDLFKMGQNKLMSLENTEKLIVMKNDPGSINIIPNKELYMQLARDSFDFTKDLKSMQDNTVKEYTDKKITLKQAMFLSQTAKTNLEQAQRVKDREDSPFFQAMRAGLDYIKGWATKASTSLNPNAAAFNLMNSLIEKVTAENIEDPEKIRELARGLVADQVRADNPATVALEDVPNATGNQANGINTVFQGDTELKADRKFKGGDIQKF